MKNRITSYFVLILFLVYSIGIAIENHQDCSVCIGGECHIISPEKAESSCCKSTKTSSNNDFKKKACSCSVDVYKIQNDFLVEERTGWFSFIHLNLEFSLPSFIENIKEKEKAENIAYFKLPDKRLYHELSVVDLSSVLC